MGEEFREEESVLRRVGKALGGMSRERRNEVYFGKPPRNAYFGFDRDLAHVHDIRMSPERISQLYGLPVGRKDELALEALHADSRQGLIEELVKAGLTRAAAEETVRSLIRRGALIEVNDPDLGKILILQERR